MSEATNTEALKRALQLGKKWTGTYEADTVPGYYQAMELIFTELGAMLSRRPDAGPHQKTSILGEIDVCDTCTNSEGNSVAWEYAHPASDSIVIPRPVVPFGPDSVPENIATAHYLNEVIRKIDTGYTNVGGSNLTATVRKLLDDTAAALRELPVRGAT